MRIVFSGNTSWSMYNFRLGVMKKFLSLGHEVYSVAPFDEYAEIIEKAGIKVIFIKKLKRSDTNPIQEIRLLKEYVEVYKEIKPDFIFHYTIKPNIYGTLAAWFCKIPSISVTTGLGNAFSGKGIIFLAAKYLYKLSSHYSKETWFLNDSDRDLFVRNNIIPLKKTFILPGEGVNMLQFGTSTYPTEEASVNFLLISRMLYDKGVELFVTATKILIEKGYNINSVLLGQLDPENPQGISAEKLAMWNKEGYVQYPGYSPNVKPYIENAHAVVLPSFYKEGIPRVLMEAACMERAIITTDTPGCTEIVDDGVNGYLCKANDVNDLVEKMTSFIELSYQKKIEMGQAGRRKMELRFDEKIIIEIYLDKLQQHLPGLYDRRKKQEKLLK